MNVLTLGSSRRLCASAIKTTRAPAPIGIAHNVLASAAETASENIDRMQQEGQQVAEVAGQQIEQMAQEASGFMQETQH